MRRSQTQGGVRSNKIRMLGGTFRPYKTSSVAAGWNREKVAASK